VDVKSIKYERGPRPEERIKEREKRKTARRKDAKEERKRRNASAEGTNSL
jgi:hypothetical protein